MDSNKSLTIPLKKEMILIPGKKDARIEFRIPVDSKELLKKRLDSEGYDTLSEYIVDKLFSESLSSISGEHPTAGMFHAVT